MKQFKKGLGFCRDSNWAIITGTRKQAIRYGNKTMPAELKRLGWETFIFENDTYYRINYSHK